MGTRRKRSQAERIDILEAYGGCCVECGCPLDKVAGFELDHERDLFHTGDDSNENLRPLCKPCHKVKTKEDAKRRAKTKRMAKKRSAQEREAAGEAGEFLPARKPRRPIQSRGFSSWIRKGMRWTGFRWVEI